MFSDRVNGVLTFSGSAGAGTSLVLFGLVFFSELFF